jgi:hypothetical protein
MSLRIGLTRDQRHEQGAGCLVTILTVPTKKHPARAPPVAVQNGRELQSALKEKVPSKIDLGPVYTQDPAKRAAYKGDTSASGFKPVERELVFDIDLTDYDDVRNSSSGTGMSRKCWSLMHIATVVRSSGHLSPPMSRPRLGCGLFRTKSAKAVDGGNDPRRAQRPLRPAVPMSVLCLPCMMARCVWANFDKRTGDP